MTRIATAGSTANAFSQFTGWGTSAEGTWEGLYGAATRAEQVTDWSSDCVHRIDRLHELKPNWDSYGANAVIRGSIQAAKQLVRDFARVAGVPCPGVAASPAGHVALSWESEDGSRELDLEILPDGMLRYAYLDEIQPGADAEGETHDANHIVQLLTQW